MTDDMISGSVAYSGAVTVQGFARYVLRPSAPTILNRCDGARASVSIKTLILSSRIQIVIVAGQDFEVASTENNFGSVAVYEHPRKC